MGQGGLKGIYIWIISKQTKLGAYNSTTNRMFKVCIKCKVTSDWSIILNVCFLTKSILYASYPTRGHMQDGVNLKIIHKRQLMLTVLINDAWNYICESS